MIITRLKGGLGNQLFQYATGRALADRLGVDLALDLSWFETQNKRQYGLSPYPLRARIADDGLLARLVPHDLGRHPALKNTLLCLAGGYWPRFMTLMRERKGCNPVQLADAGDDTILDGYWQSEAFFDDKAEAIRRDLTLSSPPQGRNAEMLMRIAEAAESAVAVHVRRGDYVTEARASAVHGVCGADYYRRAAVILSNRVKHPRWFFFSDDIEWARANILTDAERRVFVEGNVDAAHEDIRLMVAARHFIIANSSFSWWGAWLNAAPDKIVVAPKNWFHTDRSTKYLIPEKWVQT